MTYSALFSSCFVEHVGLVAVHLSEQVARCSANAWAKRTQSRDVEIVTGSSKARSQRDRLQSLVSLRGQRGLIRLAANLQPTEFVTRIDHVQQCLWVQLCAVPH